MGDTGEGSSSAAQGARDDERVKGGDRRKGLLGWLFGTGDADEDDSRKSTGNGSASVQQLMDDGGVGHLRRMRVDDVSIPRAEIASVPLDIGLPDLVAGRKVCAVAVTEPGAGSDVAGLRTRARHDGGDWVLDGTKMFITNGVHGDLIFVAARTDPGAQGARGISIFAVEQGTPGLSVGRALDKTGWRSSDTAELVFDDVRLPDAHVLGEVNRGFYAIMHNFQNERIVMGALAMSEAQTAVDLTLEHVRARRAFGGTLWDNAAVRQKLALCQTRIEAGRQLVYRAARLDAAGQDCVRDVSMVKTYCGEVVNSVLYDCVQLHGGMGFMRETPVERISRDARVQAIGGGATEVMLEEVAKRM